MRVTQRTWGSTRCKSAEDAAGHRHGETRGPHASRGENEQGISSRISARKVGWRARYLRTCLGSYVSGGNWLGRNGLLILTRLAGAFLGVVGGLSRGGVTRSYCVAVLSSAKFPGQETRGHPCYTESFVVGTPRWPVHSPISRDIPKNNLTDHGRNVDKSLHSERLEASATPRRLQTTK